MTKKVAGLDPATYFAKYSMATASPKKPLFVAGRRKDNLWFSSDNSTIV